MAVAFLSVPLTVRYLGSERYGVWMTISTLLTWLSLADIGLGNSLTNALAEAYATNRRDLGKIYVASVFWMLCVASLVIAGASAILWPFVNWGSLVNVSSTSVAAEVGPALAVTLAVSLVNFPLSIVYRVLSAYQETPLANLWFAGASVATLGGLIVATHYEWGLVPLVATYAASSALVTAAGALWLFAFYKPWLRPSLSAVQKNSVTKLLNVGGMFFVAQIAALLILQTDNLVIAHYLGAKSVTPYSVTWRLFSCSTLFQLFLMQSLWPAYAEAFARGDGAWIRQTFRINLVSSLSLTLAIVVPLICFGAWIISRWAGAQAVPSLTLLILMGIWSLIGGAFQSVVCMLNAMGRVKVQMKIGIVTAVVNIGLSIFLVRRLGIEGVILGTLVSYFVFALIPLCIETRSALSALPD